MQEKIEVCDLTIYPKTDDTGTLPPGNPVHIKFKAVRVRDDKEFSVDRQLHQKNEHDLELMSTIEKIIRADIDKGSD